MSWCEYKLEKWSDFVALVEQRTSNEIKEKEGGWFFRGQSDAEWKLEPSLLRHFPKNGNDIERVIDIDFQTAS